MCEYMKEKIFVLDIGGTYTKYAYFIDGNIEESGKWNTIYDYDKFIEKVSSTIKPDNLYGIGISSGGFWNKEGISQGFETIECTADGRFVNFLKEKYHCPVRIENDARCASICQKILGDKSINDFVFFALGSSLGCGVVIDGKILRGANNQAGSMFAMPEFFDGQKYISDYFANSLKRSKDYSLGKKGDFCFVSEMAKKGDVKAIEIIDKYCQIVALKAYYATLMYDIKTIYFGGAISQNKDLFDKINCEYEKLSTLHSGKKQATLEISAFKEEANLLGAYFLIKDMQI